MRSEQDKEKYERQVFDEFITKSGLPIDNMTIYKPAGESEPDFYCRMDNKDAAFELVEICDFDIARDISYLIKNNSNSIDVMLGINPSFKILQNKCAKNYKTSFPIYLLCYTYGKTLVTDDEIIESIIKYLSEHNSSFKNIWLLGEKNIWCSSELIEFQLLNAI
jgi:hypothetical protein